jgi:geranylgeranyl diphosphate synthase type I
MASERTMLPDHLLGLSAEIDDVLRSFLTARRRDMTTIEPAAVPLVDEVIDLVEAGGKRLRPLFCLCGYRAAGGELGTPIVTAAAAMELLHSMALIHDDVMDASTERRGRPTTEARQAERARARGAERPENVGRSVAILAGDLAAVLADDLFLSAGFPPERLSAALGRYHRMRLEMAAGQFLDVAVPAADARRTAALRGGSYTVRGPLLVGAALAGASALLTSALEGYGAPLGEAFQLADDLRDGDAPPDVGRADVDRLVARARESLNPDVLHLDAVRALSTLADRVAAG